MVAGPSMDEQDFENRTPHKKEKKGRGERERERAWNIEQRGKLNMMGRSQ